MADSSGQFTINPAEIHARAPKFSAASGDLRAALTELNHSQADSHAAAKLR